MLNLINKKESNVENKIEKSFEIPIRYFLIFNSFFAFIMVYANKVVLSVAIVAIVSDHIPSHNLFDAHQSNNSLINLNNSSSQLTRSSFNLENNSFVVNKLNEGENSNQVYYDHATKSKVLGAFFWGYIVTQVPAGRLAERFGAKWLLGITMLLCSLTSFLVPIATLSETKLENNSNAFIRFACNLMLNTIGIAWPITIIRVFQGMCAGFAHPCMHALITRWTPKNERSLTTAFIYSGSQIGTVITMPVTGFLASYTFLGGWPSVFYLLGILGIIWFILWCIFVYDIPDKHPFISDAELQNLKIGIGDDISHDNVEIAWKKVFTSLPVYAITFAHFGQNFGYFLLITELPTYLKESLNFNIKENGLISAFPYLVQALTSWISSYISDRIVKTDKYPLSWVRKGFNTIGFFGPALCFVIIALAGNRSTLVILCLIVALGLNGFSMSGFHVTHVDMAPDFAGTLMGITNGISNFNGIIAPYMVTALTDLNGETQWWAVFLIACTVYIITNLFYCWFGTSNLQTWALPTNQKIANNIKFDLQNIEANPTNS